LGGAVGARVAVHLDERVRRRERQAVVEQLRHQVDDVGDGVADDVHPVGDLVAYALVVLDLCGGGQHDVVEVAGAAPVPGGVPAGEHQTGLGRAATRGGAGVE